MKIIPTQGVVQYGHHSASVLPIDTEAPGHHGTQTRAQASPAVAVSEASPAVAESEARLVIGFLGVDN